MKKTAWLAVALSALLGVSIGCGGDSGGGTTGEVDPGAWAYPETQMVVSALYLPLSSQEAKDYGFDLDHNGTVDNQLGNILAALKSSMGDTSPQVSVDEAMGKGDIIVNGKPISDYFSRETSLMIVRQPLELTNHAQTFDIKVNVSGGGETGQAGAVRHGIAKALVVEDDTRRSVLGAAGLLTRDPRVKERKHAGFRRARRAKQFSKR